MLQKCLKNICKVPDTLIDDNCFSIFYFSVYEMLSYIFSSIVIYLFSSYFYKYLIYLLRSWTPYCQIQTEESRENH